MGPADLTGQDFRQKDLDHFLTVKADFNGDGVKDIAFLEVIGIAKVKPGEYETGWGKRYWECDKDERETLKTKPDGAEFLRDDSASAPYVYNPATHKFIPVATSD